jgi:hypothetical protein
MIQRNHTRSINRTLWCPHSVFGDNKDE